MGLQKTVFETIGCVVEGAEGAVARDAVVESPLQVHAVDRCPYLRP